MSRIRTKALQRANMAMAPRRRAAQAALRMFAGGSYNGARGDRPALKTWTPLLGGPNSDTLPDIETLRARSADLERNAPIATGVINTNITSVVGTGIVPHARIDREFLGLTDEQADKWERDAERIFSWWADSTACDIANRLDFYQLQALGFRSVLGRGDTFAIRRFVDRPGHPLSTRIQMIEADRVTNPIGQPPTDRFMGGIETDEYGQEIRVHIRDGHPGETWTFDAFVSVPEPVFGPKTGRRRVLHLMDHLRIGQVRGVPYLAPVMEALKQLDRYTEAEIMAAVVNSFLAVFIKSDQAGDVGFQDMGDPNTLGALQASGQNTSNDIRLGPGAINVLGPGESIEQTNTSRPNPQFDPFVLAVLRQIGVALEVPYELLVKHFTSSYSASRAAMIEAWRSTMKKRSWLVSTFCQPVWEWVVEEAVARKLLDAPGFFENELIRQAYCSAEWMGTSMGSLDPESDVAAAGARVDLGISTLAEETAQMTGGDWEQKHRQRVKEHRMRVEDGLDAEEVAVRRITETEPADPSAQQPTQAAAARRRISPARAERERDRAKEAV